MKNRKIISIFGIILLLAGTLSLPAAADGFALFSDEIVTPVEKTGINLYEGEDDFDDDPNGNGTGMNNKEAPVQDGLYFLLLSALTYGLLVRRRVN
jgi:hypothetical protein